MREGGESITQFINFQVDGDPEKFENLWVKQNIYSMKFIFKKRRIVAWLLFKTAYF